MNILSKYAISIVLPFVFCIPSVVYTNTFLDAAQAQVDKVVNKKPLNKPSLEFKQAVMRYIKNTDITSFQNIQRSSDENVAYKKELRYLFKNYGTFSASTLLSRLRSAHQAMVKQDTNVDGDSYQQYEQICSALLLTVSQVFCNEMRNQILQALHDIDNLLVYWNYQHNHQVYYFFHKSPAKWIVGKEQHKEIAHNIHKLERKQRELCILLGSLTEHLHSFTAITTTYEDCYTWIEHLFEIATDIKVSAQYNTDESRFDEIAALLELKLKRVGKFKNDCLVSIARARKPSRFMRNWLLYTTLLTAVGYIVHYNSQNPTVIPSALNAVQNEASKFLILLLHPLQKIYERGKLAFATEKKVGEQKKQTNDITEEQSVDREAQLIDLLNEIIKVGEQTQAAINEELAKSNTAVREDGLAYIQEALKKYPYSQMVNRLKESGALEIIKNRVEPIKVDGNIINQKEVNEYKEAFATVKKFVDEFSEASWLLTSDSRSSWTGVNFGFGLIRADDDYLTPLQKYSEIIDKKILKIFQISADIVENIGIQAIDLIAATKQLEKDAAEELTYINKQLKDHELTLMFTSLIPLGITALAGSKAYKWATTRDYSSIRIALSDINSLLIEAAHNLDDYHYGKLIYLICKLRHKAMYLKDSLANEFLNDVAKLESKQYSAQTKHHIVENMFNKYAFLGKVAA